MYSNFYMPNILYYSLTKFYNKIKNDYLKCDSKL